MNTSITVILLFYATNLLVGQPPLIMGHTQKFVHFDEIHGLILIESLEPGMTLYRLSQKYNITINHILHCNPDLQPSAVPLGYPVNIPINTNTISFAAPGEENVVWLSYRVQPKETLYRISKTYLNVTPDQITALNPSAQQGLTIGQVLHLGWLLHSVDYKNYSPITSADSTSFLPKDFIKEAHIKGQVIREQKGLAVWKPGNVSSQYFVLHPTARIGTYMEITNPMLHKTITAKVAGNIPSGLYQSHVGIVVSPSTARALGVLDQQFFARWSFIE